MTRWIEAAALKEWLHDAGEIALLDVREHGQYGASHLYYGVPLPYSRLELDVGRLVPRRITRTVVYDDGVLGVAQRAAARLAELVDKCLQKEPGARVQTGDEVARIAGEARGRDLRAPPLVRS